MLLFELNTGVWGHPGYQGHFGNHLQCSVKSQNSGILRKSIFCVFRTFLALETQLLGSHNCKNFWSKLQFWRYRFQNSYFLGELTLDISKAMAWIKLFAISKVFYSFDRHTCSSHMFVIDVRHRCSLYSVFKYDCPKSF